MSFVRFFCLRVVQCRCPHLSFFGNPNRARNSCALDCAGGVRRQALPGERRLVLRRLIVGGLYQRQDALPPPEDKHRGCQQGEG